MSAANCVFLVLKELRRHCLVFLGAFDEVRVEPACPPSHCHFQRTSAVVAVTSRVVPSAPVPREAAAESSFPGQDLVGAGSFWQAAQSAHWGFEA